MRFLILRLLTHSELGMFHEYRRQKKEGSKQRAVNFDADVVDRVFPAARDSDNIEMELRYDTDGGVAAKRQWLKRQEKNWRLEGNCPKDRRYAFVEDGCLFAMEVDAGVSPAVGSWAVFPKDHAVTTAILADGESRRLTKSAMIALHDREGERTWRVLADSRPDLFWTNHKGDAVKEKDSGGYDAGVTLAPDPKRLVSILASVGHTMPSAVADLVDNAISADATEVGITFGRPDEGHGRWMVIADNGRGMDRKQLAEAMRIGSGTEYEANSLGKYGYGLKGASWSQTKVFTVVTRAKGQPAHHLTWDADRMDGWVAKSEPMQAWARKATDINEHGTAVLWKDMRPPQTMPAAKGLDPHSAEVMSLERHLALVFHRFLEGKAAGRKKVRIAINGRPIEPNNPVGHPLAAAYDEKTIRVPTPSGDGKVRAQAWLMPSEEEVKRHHHPQGQAAVQRALDLIGLHGKRNESQGLFVYRNDRLIKWGGWHEMWATSDEKTKLARVTVDFGQDLDDTFRINISKQSVHLSQQLQEEIKRIADPARKDSKKKYLRAVPKTPGPGGLPPAPPPRAPVPTVPDGEPPVAPDPVPPVSAKPVRTDKFVWKVTTGMTGTQDVQVSALDPSLLALVKEIGGSPRAMSHLADFLDRLDRAGAQKALMDGKDG